MSARTAAWMAAIVVAAGAIACAGDPDGPTVAFRLATRDGAAATADDVKVAVGVLERRFNGAGIAGVAITPLADGRITVTLTQTLAPQAESIWKLAERLGTLELRIQADAMTERKYREVRDAGGAAVEPPAEFRWVPRRSGGPDMLVRTPEVPLLVALRKMETSGVAKDSAEYEAARKRYEDAVRAEVFTGDQLVTVKVQRQGGRANLVYFAFKEERKKDFAAFTESHVKENVAIILDGAVESAPVINSKLPGEGIIEGGGATGFTPAEAKELATVLSSGALPGRLVRETAPETK